LRIVSLSGGSGSSTDAVNSAYHSSRARVRSLVKNKFQPEFKGKFEKASPARDAVFSEARFTGWGKQARSERAAEIEKALAAG
jgi:hypothetical protein